MPADFPKVFIEQPVFPHAHLGDHFDNIHNVINSPNKIAAAVKLGSDAAKHAHFSVPKAVADEATAFYNKVVTDGRFIKDFKKDPKGVAAKLNVQLSPAAASAIETVAKFKGVNADNGTELVAVAVIVLVLAFSPDQEVIVDRSGMIKL